MTYYDFDEFVGGIPRLFLRTSHNATLRRRAGLSPG